MGKRPDYVKTGIYDPISLANRSPAESKQQVYKYLYWRKLQEMCVNRFEWVNLPPEIDPRFLEMTLFSQGLSVFFYEPAFGKFAALQATQRGNLDWYDNPTEYTVYGNNIYNKTVKASECVPIWCNSSRMPDMDIVQVYSDRLAQLDRTIDIDILNERNPLIVAVDNNDRLTMQNLISKIYDGEPVIFGTEQLEMSTLASKIGTFPLNANNGSHMTSQQHVDLKGKIWAEALTLLGIMNVESGKKERMVVEEAAAATGQVLAMRRISMEAREIACEQINRMFGLEVECHWAIDDSAEDDPMAEMMDTMNMLGGIGSGDSHDRVEGSSQSDE